MTRYDLLTPPATFFNFSLLIFDILPTIQPSAERASAKRALCPVRSVRQSGEPRIDVQKSSGFKNPGSHDEV